MPEVFYGGKDKPSLKLEQSKDLLAVRTRSGDPLIGSSLPVAPALAGEVSDGTLVAEYPDAKVEVYRVPVTGRAKSLAARKTALSASADVRFAGGVLVDPVSKEPVLYTENLFVKFVDSADPDDCAAALREAGLKVKETVTYATNAYFVEAPAGTGQKVFDIAIALLKRKDVEFSHPELIRPRERKAIAAEQWHLKRTTVAGRVVDASANVEAAHAITRGEGATIAIIDDGVDIGHPDFSGVGKIAATRDATLDLADPSPKDSQGTGRRFGENHGTCCAGVACANGEGGASGVAPMARLVAIRMVSGLGSQKEANAFVFAANNGADVISCSWGPSDGNWSNPADPLHRQVVHLPDSTRLAIDFAVTRGRGGKGCVVLFAAGNGREPVENDGYASYEKVIAVAACNDTGKQSVYSDSGKAIWCAFPSSDFGHAPFNQPEPLTPGIWTTDRRGGDGYNSGSLAFGDAAGNYANDFGGTSSACPGAAGVAALVLSVNPALNWMEVKDIMRRACDPIDPQNGAYDPATGHSAKYGHGRLNALTAVQLAKPEAQGGVTIARTFNVPIPDLQSVTATLDVPDAEPVASIAASVDIKHTYIGDLVITLKPPGSLAAIMLHNRAGGSAKDLKRTYDGASTPGLAALAGKSCKGTWTLTVQDAAAEDAGTLTSFALDLVFPAPVRVAAAAVASPRRAAARKAGARRAMADA